MDEVTLGDIRTRAIIYSNIKTISVDEWNLHINDAVQQYWNLINRCQPDYNLTSSYIITSNGESQYPLPTDCLQVRGVSCHMDNDPTPNSAQAWSLRPYTFTERDKYRNTVVWSGNYGRPNVSYRVWDGVSLVFTPVPCSSLMYVIYYIPVPPKLVNDSDTLNGIAGLDVYISSVAAKTVLDARGTPNVSLDAKISEFVDYMKQIANTHNGDEAQRIEDVSFKNMNIWT